MVTLTHAKWLRMAYIHTINSLYFCVFTTLICSGLISPAYATSATPSTQPSSKFVLGDYDKEPRLNGRVDTDRLVTKLVDLNANTYMWLIAHGTNDWQDLAIFLPKAEKAGITVWVYLVPPSETPAQGSTFHYPEPFRLDYIKWAQEIARLSLSHPNLKGYVIDDFWRNIVPSKEVHSKKFTPDYIHKMVEAGKAINPKIKFYPLMYFTHQMDDEQFINTWSQLIDGVVAAYPANRAAVENSLALLRKKSLPMIVMVSGDESTLERFNHVAGTPENIAAGAQAMTEMAQDGLIEGVVTYCLDKRDGSKTFEAVKRIFGAAAKH
ncbi:hypothetical protein GCM10008098_20660 [Rhodanobacter panaciterrae]|uniref:Uncharacterized protein n=2 Tax=Rhodanobacter panaciterrae TaxID=490572 RepID=A0ABQ2ZZG8_9GAMM|nr:hypothetical protein GCM10008098_20660 [Rhodanobacter panaciterrae]